jgi:hypothetical protein
MKQKSPLLILILFMSINLFAQKSLIDERNGFKTIKLGSTKGDFNNLSLFIDKNEEKMYRYNAIDNDLFFVFDKKYDCIYLTFDKTNSLIAIMLTKVFTGYDSFTTAADYSESTINKFERVFGKFYIDHDDFKLGVIWYGKNSSYAAGTMYFGVEKSESVLIISKSKVLSSGF